MDFLFPNRCSSFKEGTYWQILTISTEPVQIDQYRKTLIKHLNSKELKVFGANSHNFSSESFIVGGINARGLIKCLLQSLTTQTLTLPPQLW